MGRFKNRKKAIWARRLLVCSIGLLAVTVFLQWAFNKSEGLIMPLAQQEFCELITDTVYAAAEDIDFDRVITAYYTEDNKISYIRTDPLAMNAAVNVILDRLQSDIGNEDIKIGIPVGDIVGDAIALSRGPEILVELNNYRSVSAEITSSFAAAGINQTLHRLTLELRVEAVVLLPGLNTGKVTADLKIPVAETVIVGDIPKTYVN